MLSLLSSKVVKQLQCGIIRNAIVNGGACVRTCHSKNSVTPEPKLGKYRNFDHMAFSLRTSLGKIDVFNYLEEYDEAMNLFRYHSKKDHRMGQVFLKKILRVLQK